MELPSRDLLYLTNTEAFYRIPESNMITKFYTRKQLLGEKKETKLPFCISYPNTVFQAEVITIGYMGHHTLYGPWDIMKYSLRP